MAEALDIGTRSAHNPTVAAAQHTEHASDKNSHYERPHGFLHPTLKLITPEVWLTVRRTRSPTVQIEPCR